MARLMKIRAHILCWLLFISYEIGLIYFLGALTNKIPEYLLSYSLCMGLFYFHAYGVLPHFLSLKDKWKKYLLAPAIVAEAILYMALHIVLLKILEPGTTVANFFNVNEKMVASHIGRAIYFIGLSTAFSLGLEAYKRQQKIIRIQAEKFEEDKARLLLEKNLASTQLKYIKAQVHPHFIFNTINAIYSSVEKTDPKTAETVLMFSNILRYALKEPDEDGFISLQNEIQNIESLIRMAEIRLDNDCFIDLVVAGNVHSQRILPVVLGTFTENILKYGEIRDPAHPAVIKIIVKDNTLYFNTKNKKLPAGAFLDSYKTGIAFARERLQACYKENAILTIDENEKEFELTLKIEKL